VAAQKLDGMLLVLKWGAVETGMVQRALSLTGRGRFKFVVAVLNMADQHLIGRYGDKLAGAEAALAKRQAAIERSRGVTNQGAIARA
jgi:Mrp family chromosome partitioning ATPase